MSQFSDVTEDWIEDIVGSYNHIKKLKDVYQQRIKDEVAKREISKLELFNESKLKISLSKFSGYDSKLDVYTFQSDFIKIYKGTTPKRMMSDVLKNNHLEKAALSLVRGVYNIDEIWQGLKSAYSHPKLLLKKKLSEINKISYLSKLKDTERVLAALSQIINTMKDLQSLASEHPIESKLYSGDGLERIYQLLGDNRVTRWLSNLPEDEDDHEQWMKLIEFLERDLKVQQQRMLIQEKSDERRNTKQNSGFRQIGRRGAHFISQSIEKKCYFYDETDNHIATSGPRRTEIIQYFVCKKFIEMTPKERFQELRRKGYCFQCLFPGALQNTGKHSDGKCQRDFTCKNRSHDKYPTKKHVLLCHEHRGKWTASFRVQEQMHYETN